MYHSLVSAGPHGMSFSLNIFNQCSLVFEANIGSRMSERASQFSSAIPHGAFANLSSSINSYNSKPIQSLFQKTLFPHAINNHESLHSYNL